MQCNSQHMLQYSLLSLNHMSTKKFLWSRYHDIQEDHHNLACDHNDDSKIYFGRRASHLQHHYWKASLFIVNHYWPKVSGLSHFIVLWTRYQWSLAHPCSMVFGFTKDQWSEIRYQSLVFTINLWSPNSLLIYGLRADETVPGFTSGSLVSIFIINQWSIDSLSINGLKFVINQWSKGSRLIKIKDLLNTETQKGK